MKSVIFTKFGPTTSVCRCQDASEEVILSNKMFNASELSEVFYVV
jgi:hypothetical protein